MYTEVTGTFDGFTYYLVHADTEGDAVDCHDFHHASLHNGRATSVAAAMRAQGIL